MSSQKQLAANRRNAQKSTGPRSVEGKARSSQNALKTGLYAQAMIIGPEELTQFQELETQFTAEYQPATPTARSLVDQLIHCEWILRRFRWLEQEVWKVAINRLGPGERARISPCGYGYADSPDISRLYRQRAAVARMLRDTLAELRRLQPVDPPTTSPQNGFVPSNHRTPTADPTNPQPEENLIASDTTPETQPRDFRLQLSSAFCAAGQEARGTAVPKSCLAGKG
jgi:hypothetical protein